MTKVATAKFIALALGLTAAAVAPAASKAMPGVDHYRKVCAAEFTPAAFEARAREHRDTEGGTIEEARPKSKASDEGFVARIAAISDADLKAQLEAPGVQEVLAAPDSDPRLQQRPDMRFMRCLIKARVAAGKAAPAPTTAAATTPAPATPAVTASSRPATAAAAASAPESAKLSVEHYRAVCPSPGASGETEIALVTQIRNMSDAEFQKEASKPGAQELINMADNDKRLQQDPAARFLRCLVKTRIAASKSAPAASTSAVAATPPAPAPAAAARAAPSTSAATAGAPTRPPSVSTSTAALAGTTKPVASAAPQAAAATSSARPGSDYYRRACAAELTPEAAEQRAREHRDTEGGTIEEARAAEKARTQDLLTYIGTMSDSDFNSQMSSPAAQQLMAMPDNDPLLKQKAGIRFSRCLGKARLAAMKASPSPATATARAPAPAAPSTTAASSTPTASDNGRFVREGKSQCLKYQLVSAEANPGAYRKYVFSFTNKCGVEVRYNTTIRQNGVWVNTLRADGMLGIGETRVHEQTIPTAKTFSVFVASVCETKEAAERALGRRITGINYDPKYQGCTGFYWQAPTGGVGR